MARRTDAGTPGPGGGGQPGPSPPPTAQPFALPMFEFPFAAPRAFPFRRRRLPFGIEGGSPSDLQLRSEEALAAEPEADGGGRIFPRGGGRPVTFGDGGETERGVTPFGRAGPLFALSRASGAGFFEPFLPESFFDPIRQELSRAARAGASRRRTMSDLFASGDPVLRAFLELQGELMSSSDLARSLGAARAQSQQQQLDFFRDLLRQMFGGTQQLQAIRAGR